MVAFQVDSMLPKSLLRAEATAQPGLKQNKKYGVFFSMQSVSKSNRDVTQDKKRQLLTHAVDSVTTRQNLFNTEPKLHMKSNLEDRLISLRDVATRLALSQRAIYRLIAKGDLPRPVKVGGATRMYVSDIDTYLENLKSNRK